MPLFRPFRVALVGLAVLLAPAVLAQPAAEAAPAPDPERPIVRALEVRSDNEIDAERVRQALEVEIGAPLDRATVRRTLSNLHAEGGYGEIELLTEPVDGGVRAIVVLRARPRVLEIAFEGELGMRQRVVRRQLRLALGTTFDAPRIEAEVKILREYYRKLFYRAATVEAKIEQVGEGPDLRVIFAIDAGPRAKVGQVAFEGELGTFSEAELLERLRSKPGKSPSVERLDGDRRRLRRLLRSRDYLGAAVKDPIETYDAERAEIDLTFPILAGPRIELAATGIEVSELRRRDLLVFLEGDTPIDDISLEQSRVRVRDYLQGKGHYQAEVAARFEQTEDGTRRIVFDAVPGPQYRLQQLTFSGALTFDENELERHVSVGPKQWFVPGSGRVTEDELDADMVNLTSFYRLQGFDQAKIGPPDVDIAPPPEADSDAEGALSIEVPIVEGRQLRVVDVVLDGVSAFEVDDLAIKLPLQPGGPYHPLLLDDSVNVLRALYEDEGYAFALVNPLLEWTNDGTLVEITFEIDEGPRMLLDRLIIRDQLRTDLELIELAARLEPNEPLSRRKLLRAQRELYRLGIFSRVDVGLAPAAGSVERRDVLIRVQEGLRWRVSYGVSYHSDDGIGGLFGLSRTNVGGHAGRFQIDLRGSQNDRRARLVYDRPFLGRLAWPLTVSIFLRDESRPAFDVQESGGQVSLTREIERGRLSLYYDYRLVDLSQRPADPEELEREDAEVEISSITPDFLLDRRNDPVNPTRGYSTNVRTEWAFPFLKAEADFVKLFVQQTAHIDLGKYGVLAGSIRVGGIEPFNPAGELDPVVPPDLRSAQVPISERFFAGGRTTHRAYDRDELGMVGKSVLVDAEGDVLELGGNGLFLLNFDYRFPISGAFGGVVFFDVGNVWADWRDIDASDLRPGAGIGVRYLSPIGPVRVELGWKLDRQPFESSTPVILLSLGNPF